MSSSLEAIESRFGIRFPFPETATFPSTNTLISSVPAAQACDRLLKEDLRAIFAPALADALASKDKNPKSVLSCLPRDLPSCRAGSTPNPALVMIVSCRDCTAPLRLSGDALEGEIPAGMTCTRNHGNRLLKLIVTDGVTELPALEVETTAMFSKRLPQPGEKLLLKAAAVKSGTIVLDDKTCVPVGGETRALLDEYNFLKQQQMSGFGDQISDAPKLSSLVEACTNNSGAASSSSGGARGAAAAAAASSKAHQQRFQDPNALPDAASTQQLQQQQQRGRGRGGSERGARGGRGDGQQHQQDRHHHQSSSPHQGGLFVPAPRGQNNQQQHQGRGGGRGGHRGGGGESHHQHQHHHQRGRSGGSAQYWNQAPSQHQQQDVERRAAVAQAKAACFATLDAAWAGELDLLQ